MFKDRKDLAWRLRNEARKSLTDNKEEAEQFKAIARAVETPIIRFESKFHGKLPSFIQASKSMYQRED